MAIVSLSHPPLQVKCAEQKLEESVAHRLNFFDLVWCARILSDFMKFAAEKKHPLKAASSLTPLNGVFAALKDSFSTSMVDCTEANTALEKAKAAIQDKCTPITSTIDLYCVAADEVVKVSREMDIILHPQNYPGVEKPVGEGAGFSDVATFDEWIIQETADPSSMIFTGSNYKSHGICFSLPPSIKYKFANIAFYSVGENMVSCFITSSNVDFYDTMTTKKPQVDYWVLSDKPLRCLRGAACPTHATSLAPSELGSVDVTHAVPKFAPSPASTELELESADVAAAIRLSRTCRTASSGQWK
jgi:hypothetical protein